MAPFCQRALFQYPLIYMDLCQIYLPLKSEEEEILLVLANVYILIKDAHYGNVLHQFSEKFKYLM